ncbi:MAG: hypothetical protein J6X59_07900 [Bacteroidales bacterium]|nr:hypothetical protein [Bacteroidales bacterium]
MKPRYIKQLWLLWAVVVLLLAVGAALLPLWPRLFHSEVSDLYRHYEHNPHIRATELHDFPVNDTLAVDVLLLEASSDSAWCALLSDFGMPKDLIDDYLANKEAFVSEKRNSLIKVTVNKNNIKQRLPIPDPDSRLTIGSYAKRSLCIFMTEDLNIKETICSTKVKHLTDETKN